MRKEC